MNILIFFVFVYASAILLSFAMDGSTGYGAVDLMVDLDDTTTASLTVRSTGNFLSSDLLFVDDEIICYSGKTSTTFTGLTRGCSGPGEKKTSPKAHSSGTRVYSEPAGIINALVGFNLLSTLSEDGWLVGGLKVAFSLPGAMTRSFTKLVMWDFAYLEGPMVYFKYLFLWPLSAGFVFMVFRFVLNRG